MSEPRKSEIPEEGLKPVCECGDWQHSHANGSGPCGVCGGGRPPFGGCRQFRLAYYEEPLVLEEPKS